MTFTTASRMACLAFMANALAATATASDQHNFVVLMPAAMQPANVNELQTPALARLRDEGVFYSRTFSGFPGIGSRESVAYRADRMVARRRGGYAALMIAERWVPSNASIDAALAKLQGGGRPFMLIYRLPAVAAADNALAEPLASQNPSGEGTASTLLVDTERVLTAVESKLKERGLFDSTNIVVVAEHGRSTVWKQSKTSFTREMSFGDVPSGKLPPGFLAIDLIKAMLREDGGLSLYDPYRNGGELVRWWEGQYPSHGSAVIAANWKKPHLAIAARGGYDALYLPEELDKAEVARLGRYIIENLFQQDYVSGVFVNEKRIGQVGGALSLEHLNVGTDSDSFGRVPDIVVNFTSTVMSCDPNRMCAVSIADTPLQEGHDMAVGFSSAETESFMAARGPDFRKAFSSKTPASPMDMMRTIDALTARKAVADTRENARELTETLRGFERKRTPKIRKVVVDSKPSRAGEHTQVRLLSVNGVNYFAAAGAPGRSVGVPVGDEPYYWHWESPLKLVRIKITP